MTQRSSVDCRALFPQLSIGNQTTSNETNFSEVNFIGPLCIVMWMSIIVVFQIQIRNLKQMAFCITMDIVIKAVVPSMYLGIYYIR